MAAVKDQIDQGSVPPGVNFESLAGRRGAGEREDARADYGANAESNQAPGAQCPLELLIRLLGFQNQSVNTLGLPKLRHSRLALPFTVARALLPAAPRIVSALRSAAAPVTARSAARNRISIASAASGVAFSTAWRFESGP